MHDNSPILRDSLCEMGEYIVVERPVLYMQKRTGRPRTFTQHFFKRWWMIALSMVALAIVVAQLNGAFSHQRVVQAAMSQQFATPGDSPTYMDNPERSGYNSAETIINQTSARNLKLHWRYHAGGSISSEPVVANRTVFWGSWDGYEHATSLDGKQAWQTFLGKTTDYNCHPHSAGVASTATVALLMIQGKNTWVVFVAGGNSNFYALNMQNGAIIWQTSLGTPPAYFLWSSPVLYKGSVYIGSSSFGDCPLTPGELIKMDAATGAIQHVFVDVPAGCVGGGIWSSPTIDTVRREIYVTTGTYPSSCPKPEPYAVGIVELRASDLAVMGAWQVPVADRASDGDFGATPTLFQANIGGQVRAMVGVGNKNGKYYAFMRGALGHGLVWTDTLGIPGNCPECGQGIIASSAWDGSRLYVAGGRTTIGGKNCQGYLRALNPGTGAIIWQDCFAEGPALGGVTAVPGVIVVGEGNTVKVVSATTGVMLKNLADIHLNSYFFGVPTISNGVLYVGNMDRFFYAYGL
jgi:outer membrane protein assembly factor BamB